MVNSLLDIYNWLIVLESIESLIWSFKFLSAHRHFGGFESFGEMVNSLVDIYTWLIVLESMDSLVCCNN